MTNTIDNYKASYDRKIARQAQYNKKIKEFNVKTKKNNRSNDLIYKLKDEGKVIELKD